MSQGTISTIGFVGAIVAVMVDGRHAVTLAAGALALGLVPVALAIGGGPAESLLVGSAVIGAIAGGLANLGARRLPWLAGLDPAVPVAAPGQALFGPRSIRAAGALVALPAASWVSFNIPLGGTTLVRGLLFPAAYGWCCGALRLVVAGSLDDLAVGVVMVALSSAAAWLIRGGPEAFGNAALLAAGSVSAAAAHGWLSGRHRRRHPRAPR